MQRRYFVLSTARAAAAALVAPLLPGPQDALARLHGRHRWRSVAAAAEAPATDPRAGARPCRAGLRGGFVATFDVLGERFRAWVTNPQTIEQILALREGTSQATISTGRLCPGPGRGRHNAPWRWHPDPEESAMAEFTIELCDARPSYVEANRQAFLKQVGAYCPWSARLVAVVDCR